jgi:hypothetical protein
MRILVGNKGNVDFDGAVELSRKHREELLRFLESKFAVVHVEEGDEYRSDRLGDREFQKRWHRDELEVLLELKDNSEVSAMLGRTWMSVNIKRGNFYSNFQVWAGKKGYDIPKSDLKKLIEEFLKDRRIEQKKRREAKRPRKVQIQELKRRRQRREDKIRSIKIRIDCGQKTVGDRGKIEKLRKEISEIGQEIRRLRGY